MNTVSNFSSRLNRAGFAPEEEKSLFVPVTTLVLWLICACVSMIGFTIPYSRPLPPPKSPPPVQAEILKVELTSEPLPPPDSEPPPKVTQPPSLEPMTTPQIPPMLEVAKPSPSVAFALPVEAPAKIVETKPANFSKPAEKISAPVSSPPTAQPLTFGQGEGKQPAPEYPPQARRAGQEGTVTIRFNVGADGRVLSAEAISPCPWSLLNRAALRVVQERWRFSPGAIRAYEVSIRFELKK